MNIRIAPALAALLLVTGLAQADPIVETLSGGTAPATVGGYAMTGFAEADASVGSTTSAASPIDGNVLFMAEGGSAPLGMTVDDPGWWQWDHGNVYTTTQHWVELIMPANTRAFSFFVGSSFNGIGWLEAWDSDGGMVHNDFSLSAGSTPGFATYSSNNCSAITRVIVEPESWGIGNFAINQSACSTSVPEPAPWSLFGVALLALVTLRVLRGRGGPVSVAGAVAGAT